MTETERLATCGPVEVRAGIAGESRRIGGYALMFNSYSENLGGYFERIAPSFPNKSRADGWPGVVCRYNHDDAFLLGATRNGTLQLSIDNVGLEYLVALPECRNDVLEMVERGDIGNSSFAFQTFEDDWGLTERGFPLRTLVSGRLIDVAPVSTPAYRDTTVGLRSLAQHMSAPIEDVIALARAGELPRLFVRTDRVESRALAGATAKLQTLAKASKPPLSGAAALGRTLAKKHPRKVAV